jgi:hypothetical protein
MVTVLFWILCLIRTLLSVIVISVGTVLIVRFPLVISNALVMVLAIKMVHANVTLVGLGLIAPIPYALTIATRR